jgi:hypothetical protein
MSDIDLMVWSPLWWRDDRELAVNKPEPDVNVPRTGRTAVALASLDLASLALAASVGLLAGAASAAPATSVTAKPKSAAHPLDESVPSVTVTATPETPHVQSTFPAQGARVPPGLVVLRVTYDVHMRPDGWAYAEAGAPAAYPDCAKAPRLLDDKRSFVLICRTLPGKAYAVWFNRPPLVDFASMSRRPATPYELKFATTEDEPVRTLADAMKADPALAGQGEPVQAPGQARFGQDDTPPGG